MLTARKQLKAAQTSSVAIILKQLAPKVKYVNDC